MMNQQSIFRKVGSILTELNEQYEFLAQNPQQLNHLELELFLANADFLADHVRIVQKLNAINEQPAPVVNQPLLEEQNTIILPEVSPGYIENDQAFAPQELEEVITAEEAEERIDVKPEQEILDDEQNKEDTAEEVLAHDFFKPDQDNHSFEFVLGNHSDDNKFDYEAKSVEEIFDRPLSKAEEEILAQKKKIHEKEEAPLTIQEESALNEEDEIGPEPFLIAHDEAAELTDQESIAQSPVTEEPKPIEPIIEQPIVANSEPIPALKDVEMDEPVISPPVADRPIFTPEAVPVRPVEQPVAPAKPAESLNDLLAKTNAQGDEPVKSPIADLKHAINLNEKLLFIKDLFKGYNLAYSEAIDIVNKMNSFEAANNFLQSNYAMKYDWASKQATVDQFYELLNRRFSK
ncbi:hypothetical protein GJU39_05290 [Pedobacter petrophilus]|uniref:Uncharacterized protein n=1 Tax=Pedobacter petrophilus TaxID=1908241 RepID=A0A7K0FWZ6_9SPHI|nr:hypothetical protein [Pedobacter petrophilus]MRX75499.1 hypothetical protein [Pedobacter petrophilus]